MMMAFVCWFLWVIAVAMPSLASEKSEKSMCSLRKCHQSFYYEKQQAWAMTTTFNTNSSSEIVNKTLSITDPTTVDGQVFCPIRNFRQNPNYQQLSNHRVLIIGDSLALHSCFSFLIMTNSMPKQRWYWNESYDCFKDQHLHVKFLRISGIIRKVGESPANGLFDKILSEEPPNAVVFSSMVWDLLNSHTGFCQAAKEKADAEKKSSNYTAPVSTEKTKTMHHISCLCDPHMMATPACLEFAMPHVFNQAELPWCDNTFINYWRQQFLIRVRRIRAAFPRAQLYLRNQPYTSQIIMGNPMCLGSMNDIVREVATSLAPAATSPQSESCRFLNINALLARASSEQMGYTHGQTDWSRRDGLHYFNVSDIWRDFIMNTIIDNAVP